ncbi:N-alpha-acetyltransferase mak3 [Coemansia erecta]|nr:N-alpha-acetyltransferase mak3 [Coemansia erecta]
MDEYFDSTKVQLNRGYIGMVAVGTAYRKLGVGSSLVKRAIEAMREMGADEVTLEAETDNTGALALYERLGFIREKRLYRYYMSGTDAFRLKLWL